MQDHTHTFVNTGGDVRELDFRFDVNGMKIGAPFHGAPSIPLRAAFMATFEQRRLEFGLTAQIEPFSSGMSEWSWGKCRAEGIFHDTAAVVDGQGSQQPSAGHLSYCACPHRSRGRDE